MLETALKRAGAKSKGKRPYFLDNQDVEKLLNVTLALAQELAVTRERLDTLERVLAAKGLVALEEIETFAPDKIAAAERGLRLQEFLARIFRILEQENEALLRPEKSSEEVAEDLAKA